MFKQFVRYAKQLLDLTRDTQTNKDDIEELQQQVKILSETVRELTFEIRGAREHERHEREKLALGIENALLRFERQLLVEGTGGGPKELPATDGSTSQDLS